MGIVRILVVSAVFVVFLASQLFWFRRVAEWGENLIPNRKLRRALAGAGAIAYILLFAYTVVWFRSGGTPTHFTLRVALLEVPFPWWLLGSLMGFGLSFYSGWLTAWWVWFAWPQNSSAERSPGCNLSQLGPPMTHPRPGAGPFLSRRQRP